MPDTDSRTTGLEESVAGLERSIDRACETIDELRAQRDELRAAASDALETLVNILGVKMYDIDVWRRLRAAIVKAEGRS